jgi:spermidine synthase
MARRIHATVAWVRLPRSRLPMPTRRTAAPALLGIAFASGTAALVYQVVWLRWFRLLFGSTAYAASATLCAFFTGLALGALLFGRAAARSRHPLVLYAAVELGAAALALLVPVMLRLYEPVYGALYDALADQRALFVLVKYVLALAAMLPAATLLGGTFPPLAAAYVKQARDLGREGGLLYGANLLGAALGSALAAFWLLEVLGLRATYVVALGLSLALAATAWALGRSAPADITPDAPAGAGRAPSACLAIAFTSGFGTLALEVLLIRALDQAIQNSVYSFGAVLVVVLLTLALGSGLVALTARRIPARPLLSGSLLAACALLLLLPALLFWMTRGLSPFYGSLRNGLLLVTGVGGPVLVVAALVFPLTFRLAAGGAVGLRVGGLLAANTAGGILGSVLASFALLNLAGLWPSFAVLAGLYGLAAVCLGGPPQAVTLRFAAIGLLFAGVAASPASPWRLPPVSLEPGQSLVALDEGAHGVVSVIEDADGELSMKVDNHYSLAGSRAQLIQERAGHLPLLLHPEPLRVAFIGSATGGAAAAAVVHPVEQITLIELVPEVHALAAAHFGPATRGVHRDPRTRLVSEDGRNHMRAALERYDVVVADLFVPWRPGVDALYAREHFQAVRARLAPGGIFCQWLPLYQLAQAEFETLVATFLEVFPEATLWRGEFMARRPVAALVAAPGPGWTPQQVEERVRWLAGRGVEDRWVTDVDGFWMLFMGPLSALAGDVAESPRNSDDRPVFGYLAARSLEPDRTRFLTEGWPAAEARGLDALAAPSRRFPAALQRGARRGALLARASREAVANRREALQRTFAALRRELPATLLWPADPSAAETWPPRVR